MNIKLDSHFISAALQGKRQSDGSYMACCPAHDDKNPSCHISESNDGKVMVHCFAGCSQESVIAALKARNLWPSSTAFKNDARPANLPPGIFLAFGKKGESKKPYVVHWTYYNTTGEIIGYVVRYQSGENKDVIPYFKEAEKPYGCLDPTPRFAPGAAPAPRPLYDLRGLHYLQPSDVPVLVCEGEKARDAAQRIVNQEYICMTWPGGSKAASKADWTPLKHRNVVIWPDADEPGLKAAEVVKELCRKVGARSVKIVKPPDGVCSGWDLADGLAEGWDMGRVRGHIRDNSIDDQQPPASGPEKPFDELLKEATALKPDDLDAIEALVLQTAALSPTKRDTILRAIKKATGMNLGPMREILSQGEEAESNDHLDLARKVIDNIGNDNILGAGPFIYIWDAGAWRQLEDLTICQIVQQTISGDVSITKSAVDSVAAVLQREVFKRDHEFNVGNPEVVNCLNGELHLEDGIWILKPHNRENFRTSQIPVEYNPEARAPRFERFLSDVFKGDSDAWEKIKAVLEMFGYTLMAHCRHERFILLIGPGGNGKSVLMDILQWLTGQKNVVGVQPDQLDNTFKRAHLNGKLLNLVTEIKQGEVIADAALKAIVSGETCTVEHKFKPPFEMQPFSTCWFGVSLRQACVMNFFSRGELISEEGTPRLSL